jgi:NodT family efflux transporter outer membrane factor (OMF) lipoprotein
VTSRFIATVVFALGLNACSFAPAYKTPDSVPAADVYKESGDWKPAEPADTQPRGTWWALFNDPALDELETKVGDANQDLQAAYARLLQARAATRIARSSLFPTLTVGSSAVRSRTSVNSPKFPAGAEPVGNNFDLEADLSYEIDVWGRVRNAVASAKAGQQASAADLATLNLAIHAELAEDYFTLRAEDTQQVLLDTTVADYARALVLTQNLYNGGAAALTDVAQAQAQLETARTQAADIRLQRAQSEHAIAVLTGKNPSAFHLDANPLVVPLAPPAVDPGLPSTLLERRPDVAAAERRAAAANAQIGVARAAYFPVFSLGAAAGFNSATASNWLTAPSRLWSLGAAGVLTVFDAGRNRALSAQAQAAYDEQVADYRGTVLTAYQEVEDNLVALKQLEQESLSEAAAVKATAIALQQAQYRYKAGLVTYLEVVTSENTSLQAQLADVSIQLRRMTASVLLIKALGGGWSGADLQSAEHSDPRRGTQKLAVIALGAHPHFTALGGDAHPGMRVAGLKGQSLARTVPDIGRLRSEAIFDTAAEGLNIEIRCGLAGKFHRNIAAHRFGIELRIRA